MLEKYVVLLSEASLVQYSIKMFWHKCSKTLYIMYQSWFLIENGIRTSKCHQVFVLKVSEVGKNARDSIKIPIMKVLAHYEGNKIKLWNLCQVYIHMLAKCAANLNLCTQCLVFFLELLIWAVLCIFGAIAQMGHSTLNEPVLVPQPSQKIMKKSPDVNQYIWSQDFKFYEFIFNSSLENCIFRYRGYSWFSHACNMPLDI